MKYLFLLLLTGCSINDPTPHLDDPTPPQIDEPTRIGPYIYRAVDKQYGVVCYYTTYNARFAISCLPLLDPKH